VKKYYFFFIAILLLGNIILISCCPENNKQNSTGKTYVDILGRKVCIDDTPQRIVSLAPSTTEIIFALGKGAQLAGVTNQCDYPAQALSIKKVGDFNHPSIELILSCEPDLVLAGNQIPTQALDMLESMGLKIIVTEAKTIEGIYKVITDLGGILGASSEADKLAGEMHECISNITEKLCNVKPVSCYYMIAFGENGNWTVGAGSFIHELIELAGGDNIAGKISKPWYTIDLEVLLHADPEVILTGRSAGDVAGLNKMPLYRTLSAVKRGKVFVVDEDVISRPGPRIVMGLEMIARILHPDCF
jgi:iron complex transport system substrate-binding protein